jgi:predicted dehydrogenase
MKTIRYGIAGYGRFAEKAIAPAIQASQNSLLVGIQKRSLAEAREKADAIGVPLAFDSVEAMAASPEIDAIFVASANSAHHAEVCAAARQGKHVLVEKPMAMNAEEAEAMIAACAAGGVRLMVAHMLRFSPLINRMRNLVTEGVLGEVLFARAEFIYDARLSHRTWLVDRRTAGGGPIYDIGVHCLDTLRYVLDDEVESVRSICEPLPTAERTESLALLQLRFRQRTAASIFCSFVSPIRRTFIEFVGTKAAISAPDFTAGTRLTPLMIHRGGTDGETETTVENIVVPNLYVEEITYFSDCIECGRDPAPSGENGLENQRVLDHAMNPD